MDKTDRSLDALVIGAGFSGLYMLHRLRQLGIRTRVLEMAENVGGTWLFNRYPGARCDIESIEYSYSFSEEIQQEWIWTESMPAQPEIEAYLNFVADRLDLRRDIAFHTKAVAMTFDEDAGAWEVRTEAGETFRAPFVIAASGILSVPLEPDIPGIDTFAGTSLFTSRWPKEGVGLTGKREMLGKPPLKSASREEQLHAIEDNGVLGALNWGDIFFDIEANRMAAKLYGEAVARIVKDPEIAASLVPEHPFACKRPIIDQGYYETFNRDNVTLVDLRKSPIREVAPAGIRTEHELYELDVIVYATGFDAMTGALSRIDIRGRDAMSLGEFWASKDPLSYLGPAVAGFPNLFTVQGPGSPSPATNFVPALEQHVEWIGDCIAHMRTNNIRTIEALATAQQEWIDHATALVASTVLVHPSCNSWYNGGNVPGKKRMYMGYTGGIPEYKRRCDEIAAGGYAGFKLG